MTSCSLPGVNAPNNSFFGGTAIFYNGENINIPIVELDKAFAFNDNNYKYIIAEGDTISMIIWGQDEAFPQTGVGYAASPIFSRLVDENGTIFVPYIGNVKVSGLTLSETRDKIQDALSTEFINPQADVNLQIASNFNKVYIQGEIRRPLEIPLDISPLSLASAINKASGINLNTANPKDVFVIRSYNAEPVIYKLDMKNVNSYFIATSFYLYPQDIVFIGTSSLTKWNRYLSQIFPFATFINQVDQVGTRD